MIGCPAKARLGGCYFFLALFLAFFFVAFFFVAFFLAFFLRFAMSITSLLRYESRVGDFVVNKILCSLT